MASNDQTITGMLMRSAGEDEAKTERTETASPEDFRAAAETGNLGRVKRLLSAGVDIDDRDDRGCTALLRASGAGQLSVVDALLSGGADASIAAENGTTPLGAAVLADHGRVVKLLCDRGVQPEQAQAQGITPLMLAAARWSPRMVSTLLRSEADPNARDSTDTTALMAAVQNTAQSDAADAGVATVKLLLRAGADVNSTNDEGQTPLMLLLGVRSRSESRAVEDCVLRLLEILVAEGADLDRQDVSGWSALHAAAAHGFRDAAAALIEAGASRRLRDINGLSPVDLAMERSHEALVDLFIRAV